MRIYGKIVHMHDLFALHTRLVFGAFAEHTLAPATINRHLEISTALFRSARRRVYDMFSAAILI